MRKYVRYNTNHKERLFATHVLDLERRLAVCIQII